MRNSTVDEEAILINSYFGTVYLSNITIELIFKNLILFIEKLIQLVMDLFIV